MASGGQSRSDVVGRHYRDEDDYARMRRLLQDAYALEGPAVLMTVGDLDFWRFQVDDADPMRNCRLWLGRDDALRGFAWLGPGWIDVAFHPKARDVLEPMMAWAENAADTADGSLRTAALEGDRAHEAVLERRGYERESAYDWYRVRPLDDSPRRVEPPVGFAIRPVADARAWDAVARLNLVTSAAPTFSSRAWASMTSAPSYRSELDLIAVTSSEDVVAHVTGWIDERNATVLLEPVGCHPTHRRRGLVRALVSELLRRATTLGARAALVACAGGNAVAQQTYHALGFEVRGRKWTWCKALEEPQSMR